MHFSLVEDSKLPCQVGRHLRITECHINRLRPRSFLCFFGTVSCKPFWHCWSMIQQVSAKELLLQIISCGNHSCGVNFEQESTTKKKGYALWQVAWKNADLLKIDKKKICINVQWQNERPDDNPWTPPGAMSTENKNIRRIFAKKSLFFETKIESALPFTSASKPTFPRGFLLQALLHCYW